MENPSTMSFISILFCNNTLHARLTFKNNWNIVESSIKHHKPENTNLKNDWFLKKKKKVNNSLILIW
jgi:hypothetical protein